MPCGSSRCLLHFFACVTGAEAFKESAVKHLLLNATFCLSADLVIFSYHT